MGNLIQDSKKSARSNAQQIARQMAREPLEILKGIPQQISPVENLNNDKLPNQGDFQNGQKSQKDIQELKRADNAKSQRMLFDLEQEIKRIKREKLYYDLMAKVQGGEYVPLQDYPELSFEERQVLNAQYQAVLERMNNAENSKSLIEPSSRHSRRFGMGRKPSQNQMESVSKKVDVIKPPSG